MLSGYAQELQALKAELQHTLVRLGGDCSSAAAANVSAPPHVDLLPPPPPVETLNVRAPTTISSSARRERYNLHPTPSWSTARTRSIATAQTTPAVATSSTTVTGPPTDSTRTTIALAAPMAAAGPSTVRHTARSAAPTARAVETTRLVQELRLASQRRRALEIELANERYREHEQIRRRHARAPWQHAITALQRQRADIARQIEAERQRDAQSDAATAALLAIAEQDDDDMRNDSERPQQQQQTNGCDAASPVRYCHTATQMSPAVVAPSRNQQQQQQHSAIAAGATIMDTDSRYAIEGVVTLERLAASTSHFVPRVAIAAAPAPMSAQPSRHDSTTHEPQQHDAMRDVFALQLQFAETMRKLETSVHVRDQLLQQQQRRPYEQQRTSKRTRKSAAAGSSRRRQQQRYVSSDSDSVDSNSDSMDSNSDASSLSPSLLSLEQHTPSTERSDKSAVASPRTEQLVQEVVVIHSALTTPVIAKRIAFESPSSSDDDDDEEEDEEEEEEEEEEESANRSDTSDSSLSFMGGSSVTSTELNDESLVRAFGAFRHELTQQNEPVHTLQQVVKPAAISAAISAARALFSDRTDAVGEEDRSRTAAAVLPVVAKAKHMDDALGGQLTPSVVTIARVETHVAAMEHVEMSAEQQLPLLRLRKPQTASVNRAVLQERRQQLCLDIQAESAQLVLTSDGASHEVTARRQQMLAAQRSELQRVDEQLAALELDERH